MASIAFSDEDIVKGIVAHDTKIYEYLDNLYRPKVLSHVHQNSGSTEEGYEHYQDVIFEIYLVIDDDRYNENAYRSFEQFFWIVTKNRWIDKLRKRKGIFITELNEAMIQKTDHSSEQKEADAMYTKLVMLINKYLRQLSNEEQEYLKLYYHSSKSVQFIANNFDTSYDYARLKLHRIRDKLRKFVKDDPEYDSLPNLITI